MLEVFAVLSFLQEILVENWSHVAGGACNLRIRAGRALNRGKSEVSEFIQFFWKRDYICWFNVAVTQVLLLKNSECVYHRLHQIFQVLEFIVTL